MTAAGEAMRTVPAHAELERRYRRLLRAYPAGYRRTYGEEILGTLMDCAEPGRRRPALADVVDLARGAVRQWFRLPTGWSAAVAAVLSALVLGAMGAAAGSWLAGATAAELPSSSVALRSAEALAGAPLTAPEVTRYDGWRLDWRTIGVSNHDLRGFPDWTLGAAQARLRADGWTIGRGEEHTTPDYGNQGSPATLNQLFLASRDGHVLVAYARTSVVPDGAGTTVSASIHPATPGWEPGAIVLGWLIGAITGWILAGWAGYRLRRRALPLRAAAVALGLIALWSAVDPTRGLYLRLGELAFPDPGVQGYFPAYGSVTGRPEQVALTLALGVAILALSATGRPRPAVVEAA